MKRTSIIFTITVSFIISIILLVGSFIVLINHDYQEKEKQLFDRYSPVLKMVFRQERRQGLTKEFFKDLKEMGFTIILDKNKINAISYNPQTKVLVQREKHHKSKNILRVLNLNNQNYIYMKKGNKTLLIRDDDTKNSSSQLYIILVFAILFITIILVYIITLRKLMPLKLLKDKVKTLGDENFDFECCNSQGEDEVSQLAMEFKKAAKKLKDLKEARNIFIRNIMHELKTPITKGKFLTQLEQNEQNNEKLKSVFNRLEALINEFASIEELISSTKNIEKKHYFLDDIIDNAKDILMIDDEFVEAKYENKKLEVNFKLFSIAMKNLIDNAIKYSSNKKVVIKSEDENIVFENNGEALQYPLQDYFEPFFSNEDKSKDSFGLGLYIVYNILKANTYTLEYEYINGINRFICKKDKISTI